MKILVPTKRVVDTDQRIRVREDGTSIEANDLPYVVNPFDAIAIEEALRIQENSSEEVEIVAVGIGPEHYEAELRTALAMGVDRAMLIECNEELDPWNVARILCEVVRIEHPDLIIMGKQAVDDDSNQTGQFLAASLDWPQATFASKLEFVDQRIRVTRETDAGNEILTIELPAVITSDLRLNEPRYASLPSILKSRKKTIERIDFHEMGVEIQPRIRVLRLESASTRRDCVHVDTVDDLLNRLQSEAKVI